ncbi:D-Ala-D/L-Ala epimerase [Paraconexibacter sp. AEG42_29]|uniref:D-Ala-D/L-Ala epimerase n=1 Tax=Paraconexibacter sp. AEG42_29 TaxID=2997339 RepID=A0AAU7AV70_9ACTN
MPTVALHHESIRLHTPLPTAFGEIRERDLLIFELTGADGVTGRGEAAPLTPYDGVPLDVCAEALAVYASILQSYDDDAPGVLMLDACREAADIPVALAAVDLALWDRAGRRAGRPVASLLTDEPLDAVPVNATIGAVDRQSAASAAAAARDAGYSCIKLKVGVGDDAGRVAAVRAAAGPQMLLRLDANGAWDVEQAVRAIEVLSPAGLEFVEEPVHGLQALRAVRERVAARVSMDETAEDMGALIAGGADAVCLKISRCGGIAGLLAQAALVRSGGAEVYVASTFDGPLGIAAGVHVAAALRVQAACGLATLEALDIDVPEALRVRGGMIRVPTGPGLGV